MIAAPLALAQQEQELELLLLEAKVNRLKKGDVIISKDQDSRVWIKAADFPKLSLQPPPDKILEKKIINNMAFLALPSPALSLALDLDALTIEINAPPTWLEYQHIDLSREKKHRYHLPLLFSLTQTTFSLLTKSLINLHNFLLICF